MKINPYSFTLIDVGANVGGFSILLSNEIDVENFNIHLFEPNPDLAKTLGDNMDRLALAVLPAKPTVTYKALGDRETVLPLKINESHSGTSTLGKSKRHYSKAVDVQVTTIDAYAKEKKLEHVDFIKIDAEAFEPCVLKGAMQTIADFKPTLYLEYSLEWFDNFSQKYISTIFTYLNSLGYIFLREGKDGKMHYFSVNENTLRQYRHLNLLGIIKYE
jgi:FkbM family methyltransferase